MTTLIRSTKSGSEWTKNEHRAYNITVTPQNVATFFGNPTLPQPSVHQVILDNEEYPANGIVDKDDRKFFFYLEEAMAIPPGEESAVDDFTAHLLALLGYDVVNRFIRQRKDIPLFMCWGQTHANTDVCVVDRNLGILLLVQEDKRHLEEADPEPQLIAEAIAAFQHNNTRLQRIGVQPIQKKTIPGITMIGSTPTFYKITITQDLVEAVETAQYPANVTTVHKLVPPVDDLARLSQNGMKPLNNRAVILRCFEAFRQFV
ncbi:hypothetical protein OG21DRAFT_615014 [Imleria badia]|nr:hypothetical protein OG21DRAFT_615014 [Imleria badia]